MQLIVLDVLAKGPIPLVVSPWHNSGASGGATLLHFFEVEERGV